MRKNINHNTGLEDGIKIYGILLGVGLRNSEPAGTDIMFHACSSMAMSVQVFIQSERRYLTAG